MSPDIQEERSTTAIASGRAFAPITIVINKDHTVADLTIPIAGNGTNAASNAAFHLLRQTIVPETVGALPNTQAGVTGMTATWQDTVERSTMSRRILIAATRSALVTTTGSGRTSVRHWRGRWRPRCGAQCDRANRRRVSLG